MNSYPDCYLHVRDCRSGQEWVVPIGDNDTLDLSKQIAEWAKREFAGDLALDAPVMPKLEGDYYARIMTDGRPPDSIVCWTGGGFYLAWIGGAE